MEDQNIKTYRVGNLVIKIDRSKCISCGTCAALAPNTFEMGEDLIAKVKDSGPYDDEATIKQAEGSCSGRAIMIETTQEPVAEESDIHQLQ